LSGGYSFIAAAPDSRIDAISIPTSPSRRFLEIEFASQIHCVLPESFRGDD
jgi:hypothetical protein